MSSTGSIRRSAAGLAALAAASLVLAGGCKAPTPVLWDGIGKPRFTRCFMKPDGPKIYSAVYGPAGGLGIGIRPGTDAEITYVSDLRIDVTINKVPYQLYPVDGEVNTGDVDGFVGKYFVDTPEDVGLDALDPSVAGNVKNGTAAIGMTKQEVYMAIGPPALVNFDEKTLALTYEQIMSQNRWVYYANAFTLGQFKHVFNFVDDKLATVEQ